MTTINAIGPKVYFRGTKPAQNQPAQQDVPNNKKTGMTQQDKKVIGKLIATNAMFFTTLAAGLAAITAKLAKGDLKGQFLNEFKSSIKVNAAIGAVLTAVQIHLYNKHKNDV